MSELVGGAITIVLLTVGIASPPGIPTGGGTSVGEHRGAPGKLLEQRPWRERIRSRGGLDVYRLWESLRAVLGYLQEHEPASVDAAVAA